jgi:hypothetical protein
VADFFGKDMTTLGVPAWNRQRPEHPMTYFKGIAPGPDFGHGGRVVKITKLDFLIYVLVALIALCAPFAYEVYANVRLPWLFTNGPAFAGLLIAWWIIARRIKK